MRRRRRRYTPDWIIRKLAEATSSRLVGRSLTRCVRASRSRALLGSVGLLSRAARVVCHDRDWGPTLEQPL
jgi:hypothetical protein